MLKAMHFDDIDYQDQYEGSNEDIHKTSSKAPLNGELDSCIGV